MSAIVSVHSYRGGTGKSNIVANLAYLAARSGRRVAVMDTDLPSPGLHLVLGLERERIVCTLSDYLFGKCELEEAAYDLSRSVDLGGGGGALFLIPASLTVEAITRILAEGYDASKLNGRFKALLRALDLEILFLDTHPGLNRETLLTTAISDILLILIRPDQQDYHGTAVLCEVAGRLNVPKVFMAANKVLLSLDPGSVREKIEKAFGHPVIGVLPVSEEMLALGSRGLFAVHHPDHPLSAELHQVVNRLLENECPGTIEVTRPAP
jgi:MinD-like ATPase involved in chromosome partitioning or flagellar assembly